MIVNLTWSAVPALIAFGAGLNAWQALLVWWVAFRAEYAYDALAAMVRISHARGINESAVQQAIGDSLLERNL